MNITKKIAITLSLALSTMKFVHADADVTTKDKDNTIINESANSDASKNVQLILEINKRFEAAAKAFSANENGEIKAINSDGNGPTRENGDFQDSPKNVDTNTFLSPTDTSEQMICYDSKGNIEVADDSELIGKAFNEKIAKDLITQINSELSIDGKAEVNYKKNIKDPNNSKKTLEEKRVLIAWNEKALVGKTTDKGLVCTISAIAQ
jgi:hypothetical protein